MSIQTIRFLIAAALFVHGVGHTLGIWKPARSLPFLKIREPALRLVGGILWVLVALGFVVASMGFFGLLVPAGWWRPLAVVFALISMGMLLLFGRSWPLFNFIGASAMNIAVLVALVWLRWPPFDMFAR